LKNCEVFVKWRFLGTKSNYQQDLTFTLKNDFVGLCLKNTKNGVSKKWRNNNNLKMITVIK
jgi:hypothetical protein